MHISYNHWWQKLPQKFPGIELGEYQTMPNHFHAILINVGAYPRVCPGPLAETTELTATDEKSGCEIDIEQLILDSRAPGGGHAGSSLHTVMQWFKTMSTNHYIRNVKQNAWQPFNKKLWQRNYFEHIIRNEKSFRAIANYIYNNPVNWKKDKLFIG